MANDDLLQQLDKLIQQRLEENNKQQDENLQKRLDANNQQLKQDLQQDFQNRLDAAVNPIHERLDAQREQIANVKTELSEKIDQQAHDVADILAKAIMPDIDRHDVEIKELQKAVGLRPKH